jgi:hypothetical protein
MMVLTTARIKVAPLIAAPGSQRSAARGVEITDDGVRLIKRRR